MQKDRIIIMQSSINCGNKYAVGDATAAKKKTNVIIIRKKQQFERMFCVHFA